MTICVKISAEKTKKLIIDIDVHPKYSGIKEE